MPLIICEVSLSLTWSVDSVLTSHGKRERADGDNPVAGINNPTNGTFKKGDTKFCVPVVILWSENDIKLLDKLKSGFKITIKWNKYRSKMTKQTKNIKLNYLIDPTFTKVINYLSYQLQNKVI